MDDTQSIRLDDNIVMYYFGDYVVGKYVDDTSITYYLAIPEGDIFLRMDVGGQIRSIIDKQILRSKLRTMGVTMDEQLVMILQRKKLIQD